MLSHPLLRQPQRHRRNRGISIDSDPDTDAEKRHDLHSMNHKSREGLLGSVG
jgi:hypothetical protein